MVNPNDVKRVIEHCYSRVKVTITDAGPSSLPSVHRYIISCELFGCAVKINLGENLVVYVDEVPLHIARLVHLGQPKVICADLERWLKDLPKTAARTDLPLVKDHARKFLGPEISVKKESKRIVLEYQSFLVIISPTLALVALKSSGRGVLAKELNDANAVELFFKQAKFTAQSIADGSIK